MKLSGLILKLMKNCIKLSEHVYHTQRPSNEPFSEHVLFVQAWSHMFLEPLYSIPLLILSSFHLSDHLTKFSY